MKKAGMFTKIVLLALLIYASVTLVSLRARIESAKAAQEDLQKQIASITAENEDMKNAIANSDSDEVIGDIAEDKLGLADPDERVFYSN